MAALHKRIGVPHEFITLVATRHLDQDSDAELSAFWHCCSQLWSVEREGCGGHIEWSSFSFLAQRADKTLVASETAVSACSVVNESGG